jgi:hypothetical protein
LNWSRDPPGLLGLSELVVELIAHFEEGGHFGGLLGLQKLEGELMAHLGFSSYVCTLNTCIPCEVINSVSCVHFAGKHSN